MTRYEIYVISDFFNKYFKYKIGRSLSDRFNTSYFIYYKRGNHAISTIIFCLNYGNDFILMEVHFYELIVINFLKDKLTCIQSGLS